MNTPSVAPDLIGRAKEGDRAAQNKIVRENLGLVYSLAARLCGSGLAEYEDLVSAGSLGLLKAIMNFDTSRGFAFSTYAVPVIAGEMRRFIRDNGPVKVSRDIKENAVRIHRASRRYEAAEGRSPTPGELADMTGLGVDEITLAMDSCAPPLSLDQTLSDGEQDTPLFCLLGEEDAGMNIERISLKQALADLSADDAMLISLRYFRGYTQSETAKCLHTTQVQISRREKRILLKLREMLSA